MKSVLLLILSAVLAKGADKPPNIVFILADDLGITDIGAYARHFNEVAPEELFYETPNLDRLVGDGIAFSQSYANQLCTPSRAATTNQPFKGGKAMLYEGGIRVPTIVWQPGRLEGGKWSDAVIDCTDFLPAVAELTGNTPLSEIDGRSFLPLLEHPSSSGAERTLIWHYPFNVIVQHPDHGQPLSPHSAIRVGDHKLIWNWHGKLELYDIPADPTGKRDFSAEKPELTEKLHTQLKQWLTQNVAPRYWPQRDEPVSPEAAAVPFPFRDLR